ncbi:unnamed protein product [Calypogeia fissa]
MDCGIPEPGCNDFSQQGRENRLGLHRLDGGFVPGSRFPPASGTGPLTTFDRLGFGQEPHKSQYVHYDDHQASHPIAHRHAPLGMPRRLGSGPDEFQMSPCDFAHSTRSGSRVESSWSSNRPRQYGNETRGQRNPPSRQYGNETRGQQNPPSRQYGNGTRGQQNPPSRQVLTLQYH